jgi:hypothetical protein
LQLKKHNFFTAFSGWSFGFSFQRWYVQLEKVFLWQFESRKMEKNWERSAKVFGHRQEIGEGPVYLWRVR